MQKSESDVIAERMAGSQRTVVSVSGVGKQYWLQQPAPATFQHVLLQIVKRARSTSFWALRDVSFDIGQGESVAIIGANGAGKSTLLRLLCGLGRPTTGSVRIEGRLAALLELGAGFHPHLTGRENLYVSGIVSGLSRRELNLLSEAIIDFAELGEFIDQPLRTYSSGMQMRLGFAVAIHVDPAVLIIDETLAVGDAHFQQKCLDRIETFRKADRALLIVSHDMATVRSFCTRALWLQHGRLMSDGPVDRVVSEYEAAVEKAPVPAARGGATTSGGVRR